ncbi:MAG: hypothetical protein HC892_00345 [Saprospiraceae bacterium]|nr:hypothetical protein [Saprospiraceae bacterium]
MDRYVSIFILWQYRRRRSAILKGRPGVCVPGLIPKPRKGFPQVSNVRARLGRCYTERRC